MLIQDLNEFIVKQIKGVFHIGAHIGEEKSWYNAHNVNNVVWFEANPNYENIIKNNVGNDLVIISAIGNETKKVNFNISNNGQSSSVLELGVHKNHHPDVNYIDNIEINMDTIYNLVNKFKLNIESFNFINIDIQGYELEALKGFGNLLHHFDYIYSEVNTADVYVNCSKIEDLDDYLKKFGFNRVAQHITNWEWGDAFYVKKHERYTNNNGLTMLKRV